MTHIMKKHIQTVYKLHASHSMQKHTLYGIQYNYMYKIAPATTSIVPSTSNTKPWNVCFRGSKMTRHIETD